MNKDLAWALVGVLVLVLGIVLGSVSPEETELVVGAETHADVPQEKAPHDTQELVADGLGTALDSGNTAKTIGNELAPYTRMPAPVDRQAAQVIDTLILPPADVSFEAETERHPVVRVVDGDTVIVRIDGTDQTLRLIGIDTPETVDPRTSVQCYGAEASKRAKELLSGRTVTIETDTTQGTRDTYGRLLAYVHRDDGLFFNRYMVEEGYAHEYTYDQPYKYQEEFQQAERQAQAAGKGLWSASTCGGDTTQPAQIPSTPGPTAEQSSTQPNDAPNNALNTSSHTYYMSTYHTARFYYCDTDDAWNGLSPTYLVSYPSEATLLADHPTRQLHEVCR